MCDFVSIFQLECVVNKCVTCDDTWWLMWGLMFWLMFFTYVFHLCFSLMFFTYVMTYLITLRTNDARVLNSKNRLALVTFGTVCKQWSFVIENFKLLPTWLQIWMNYSANLSLILTAPVNAFLVKGDFVFIMLKTNMYFVFLFHEKYFFHNFYLWVSRISRNKEIKQVSQTNYK